MLSEINYQELTVVYPFKKGRELSVTVLQPREKEDLTLLSVGEKAIILGAIVHDPTARIAGYSGDAARVVWPGMIVNVQP